MLIFFLFVLGLLLGVSVFLLEFNLYSSYLCTLKCWYPLLVYLLLILFFRLLFVHFWVSVPIWSYEHQSLLWIPLYHWHFLTPPHGFPRSLRPWWYLLTFVVDILLCDVFLFLDYYVSAIVVSVRIILVLMCLSTVVFFSTAWIS